MKILVLDNYDSFTYNLVHIIKHFGYQKVDVIRNDQIKLNDVGKYDKILLSPGPGIPKEAGIMLKVIKKYASQKSILGVCLGHQGVAEAFGARIYNMKKVLHGLTTNTMIINKEDYLFEGVPERIKVGHYHSWCVDPTTLNNKLETTAVNEDNMIMALKHKKFDVRGVQFHPESILTEHGKLIIKNWLGH